MRTTNRMTQVAAIHGAALIICALAVPAFAVDCPELVGTWPFDPAYAIAASGDHAYFSSAGHFALLVADVSDRSAPDVVGQVVLPGLIEDIEVSGNHAFVAAWQAGLRVVDVSDPTDPVEVAFVDMPGEVHQAEVSGEYVFLAESDAGMEIYMGCECFSDSFESGDTSLWSAVVP